MAAGTMEVPAGTDPGHDDEPQDVHEGGAAGGELSIGGDGQLSFEVGGKRPTTSSLRLVGGRVDISGQFAKGERIRLYVECEVRSIEFRDETDKATGQVVGSERRHKAAITGVERVD